MANKSGVLPLVGKARNMATNKQRGYFEQDVTLTANRGVLALVGLGLVIVGYCIDKRNREAVAESYASGVRAAHNAMQTAQLPGAQPQQAVSYYEAPNQVSGYVRRGY